MNGGGNYYTGYSEDMPKYMDADSWNNNEKMWQTKLKKRKLVKPHNRRHNGF